MNNLVYFPNMWPQEKRMRGVSGGEREKRGERKSGRGRGKNICVCACANSYGKRIYEFLYTKNNFKG